MLGFLHHETPGMILMVPFFICFPGANQNLNRDRIIETAICKKLQLEYMQY
jgi:glycopeptide antibiotics resistance protein